MGPSFWASPWVCWSYSNWTTTTMCSFIIQSIKTKFTLVLPTIRVFVNSNLILCHYSTSQTHRLVPHIYHVNFKEGVLQNEVHFINFTKCEISTNSNVLHHRVTTALHLGHVAYPFQTADWWACPFYASARPNLLVSFGLMKECIATLSPMRHFDHSFKPQGTNNLALA